MPTAETQVATERAGRYLTQLCRHLNHMNRTRHGSSPTVEDVTWSDTAGTIRFSEGTCTLSATAGALTVRLDAETEDALRRLREGVTRRLETVGRRERLTVHWGPNPAAPRTRRVARVVAPAVVLALAVAVHIGLLGSAAWAKWGVSAVLAIVALKLIAVVVLGRFTLRHRWLSRRNAQ